MTRPTAIASLALVVGLTFPRAATAQTPARLTLDEAVRLSLDHNTTIESADLAEAKAGEEVEAARTRRLPSLNVEAQASRLLRPVDISFPAGAFGSFPGTGPVPAADTTVTTPAGMTMLLNASAAQPLTGLIQAGIGVRQSENARTLAHEDGRAARLGVVRQVKRAYYSIQEATSALEATETNGRLLAELSRVVSNRVVQQVALRADSLDVDARVAQNEVTQVTLRHAIASSKEQLNHLLGRDLTTDFDVEPVWHAAEIGADDPGRGPAQRPDVQQARLRVDQADLAVKRARADLIPEVNLVMQSITPINIDGAPGNITSAGVQVKWEPFDWGRKARVVAARRLDHQRATKAEHDTEVTAQLEINRARRSVEEALASLHAAALAQNVARERVRIRATQYQTQTVLLSDVLQAQASLAESTNQYQRAVLSLLSAHADLDHALGEELVP